MDLSMGIVSLFLLICAIFDWKTKKIPLWTVMLFFLISVLYKLGTGTWSFELFCRDIAPGVLILLTARATKEKIGYGDGLVLLVSGILIGFNLNIKMFLLGVFLSSLVSCIKLIRGKSSLKDKIAFIPYLFSAWGVIVIGM